MSNSDTSALNGFAWIGALFAAFLCIGAIMSSVTSGEVAAIQAVAQVRKANTELLRATSNTPSYTTLAETISFTSAPTGLADTRAVALDAICWIGALVVVVLVVEAIPRVVTAFKSKGLDAQLGEVKGSVNTLDQTVDRELTKNRVALEGLSQALGLVQRSLTNVSGDLTTVDTRLTNVNANVMTTTTRLEEVAARLQQLDNGVETPEQLRQENG